MIPGPDVARTAVSTTTITLQAPPPPSPSRPHHHRHPLVVSADGGLVGSGRVGDGVEDVQSTRSDQVWVSYFDQGVFGSDEIAAASCVRWEVRTTDDGCTVEPAWKLHCPPMADCYTMNAAGRATYVCAYTGFHIITVEDGRALLRDPVVIGPQALVTNGYQMAVVGSYDQPNGVTLVTLEHDACRVVGHAAWTVPGTKARDVRLAGRGDRLHGFTLGTDPSSPQGRHETRWWTTSLPDPWG